MTDVPVDPSAIPHRVAELLQTGTTAEQLRSSRWEHPFHGVARPRTGAVRSTGTRIRDAAALLGPGGALGGWAAAYWQGVGTLNGWSTTGAELPVLLHVGPRHQLRRRPGIVPTRLQLTASEIIMVGGRLVTCLPRAIYDEMRVSRGLAEAVAVVDAGVSALTPGTRTSLDEVQALIEGKHRTRGLCQAREAASMASQRTMSRGESRLRVVCHDVGLEGLLVNAPIFDATGRLVGIADLIREDSGLVLEYDGAGHRESEQHLADNVREESFEDLGLVVVRAGSADLRTGPELKRRIDVARRRGERRDRRADRWTTTPPRWWTGSRSAARWGHPPWL